MNRKFFVPAAVAIAMALPGAAAAEVMASATTDLNIRSGPGPQYPVIGVINSGGQATIAGCMGGSQWCSVNHNGVDGWAYSAYLTSDVSGAPVVIAEHRSDIGLPVVTYEGSADATVTGAVGGALAGALIGGPVGAAVGGVAGAATGAMIDPPAEVRTHVTANQVQPVYLEGEVVVGAALPETVELRPIPDYEYSYVYVNGQPVLVEPASRQIVYVVR